jgi:hypothetical protein
MLQASGALSALGLTTTAMPLAALPRPSSSTEGVKAPTGFPQLNGHEKQNLFTEIGVRPILNARGTYTIITGSCSLPEVKRAMYEASFYFVQLDELMAAVGQEIASLMGAPSAVVTTGLHSGRGYRKMSGAPVRPREDESRYPEAFAQSLRLRGAHNRR